MSIDEFFAKKDKKVKMRAKFTTLDTIAKKLEEGMNPVEDNNANKEKEQTGKGNLSSATAESSSILTKALQGIDDDDDEWECSAADKEKDYSGLKLQYLSMSEKAREEQLLKEQANAETSARTDCDVSPWRVITPKAVLETVPERDTVVPESKPVYGRYIPPALRQKSSSSTSFASAYQRVKKTAETRLQLSSEIQFPSLASSMENDRKQNLTKDANRSGQFAQHGSTAHCESLQKLKRFSSLRFQDNDI